MEAKVINLIPAQHEVYMVFYDPETGGMIEDRVEAWIVRELTEYDLRGNLDDRSYVLSGFGVMAGEVQDAYELKNCAGYKMLNDGIDWEKRCLESFERRKGRFYDDQLLRYKDVIEVGQDEKPKSKTS